MCTFTDRFFRSSSDDSSEDSDSEEDSSELELSIMKRIQYCSSQPNKNRNKKKNHIAKGLTIFFFFWGGGGERKPSLLLLSLEESESPSLAPALFCDMIIFGAFFRCSLSSSLKQKASEFPSVLDDKRYLTIQMTTVKKINCLLAW